MGVRVRGAEGAMVPEAAKDSVMLGEEEYEGSCVPVMVTEGDAEGDGAVVTERVAGAVAVAVIIAVGVLEAVAEGEGAVVPVAVGDTVRDTE